ncbi:DUF6263 family protein [Corynebacterium suicordis]
MVNQRLRKFQAVVAMVAVTALAACGEEPEQASAPVEAPVEGMKVELLDAGKAPQQPVVWFTDQEEQHVNYSITRGLEQNTEVDEKKAQELAASSSAAESSAADSSTGSATAGPDASSSAENSASASESTSAEEESNNLPYEEVTMNLPLTTGIKTDGDTRTSTVTVGKPTGDNTERNEDIASAEGFRMTTEQDRYGRPQNRTFSSPEGASDSARASVEEALVQMNNLPLIFPEEPIGEGASWTVSNRVEDGGISFLQTITYTLLQKQNQTVSLSVSAERKPATQFLNGSDLRIMDVSTESSGHISVNLTHAVPERGSISLSTVVTYGKEDSATRVKQKTTSKSSWSPAES